MKKTLAVLLLLAAAFAANMPDAVDAGPQPALYSAAPASPVMVRTTDAGGAKETSVTLSAGSITASGVTATTTGEVREKNGTLTISNAGIEKTITCTPDGVQMAMETRGVTLVKTMNLSIEDGSPVYIVKAEKTMDVGTAEPLPVAVESTVSAETGEVTNETEVINPATSTVAVRSEKVRAEVTGYGKVYINRTEVNGTLTKTLEVQTPTKTIVVSVVPGEGATVTMNGVAVNTHEDIAVEGESVTAGGQSVAVMPDQARAKVAERAQVSEFVLEKLQSKLQYRIETKEQKHILGIIPADVESTTTVDATTGSASTKGPWWGFLAF